MGQLTNTEIQLPLLAQNIPGLVARHFRGRQDYDLMADIMRDCKEADQLQQSFSAEKLQNELERRSNFDPYRDIVLVEIDGRTVAFGHAYWVQEESGLRVYISSGRVIPAWRRHGIGTALYTHNMRQLTASAQTHPLDGPRVSEIWASDGETSLTDMVTKLGYKPSAFFALMVRPDLENIPDLPMPDGLEIRPVLPEHYRAIWDANYDAFRDHWGYIPPTEKGYQAFLKEPNFDPSLWRVAWAGDEVAGMVRTSINLVENEEFKRRRGWMDIVSVRRPWRRLGLARALLAKSLHAVKERGMTEAALGVHTDNPNGAFTLYEGLGYQKVEGTTAYQKPMEVTESESNNGNATSNNQ